MEANGPEAKGDARSEERLLRFQVITDTHVRADGDHLYNRRLARALADIAATAPDSAGIMHVGDVTDHGFPDEYAAFRHIWDAHRARLPELRLTTGNHDVRFGVWESRIANFLSATEMPAPYHDHWIEGVHFIFLGTETNHELHASLSGEQLAWLAAKLDEGASSRLPAFVFLHQPLLDTVAGSRTGQNWHGVVQDAELKAVLAKHRGGAILFTGHTHWEMEAAHNHFAGDEALPPMFNAASVAYLWTDADERKEGSQGYDVEVYRGRVVVRGRDFERGAWIAGARYELAYPRA
ncbi:metallophosphoesterase [Paenibacillus sp. MWE-103]|uniref:Metallophosphoesterase n=1 Tax=Paenibacillus artemisiicola TaxID=1172618 RepID=A0ABS3WFN7_9BACL|nr:metallophosphoesterase [Paenibacillus artemisiicola]MBO7747137.1 metallophosphoesterase [Paenibacillus artemisiicola]